jgi:hypothetical protein
MEERVSDVETLMMSGPVPTASQADSLKAFGEVVLPVLARGAIVRRPPVVKVAEKLDADRRAISRMQELAATYGRGPVLLQAPYRDLALVLEPDDVRRILTWSPEPFATANAEKRSALAHFQPHGVLISHGPERDDRRRFNDEVLGNDLAIHPRAGELLPKVVEEAEVLATTCPG